MGSRLAGSRFADMQQTIQHEVTASGIGLFTGEKVSLKLKPAPTNAGVIFRRTDLPKIVELPAHLSFVRETPRCTRLANEKASIHMVEHLLSAVRAFGIDNLQVDLEGPEVPSGDGSSKLFIELLERAKLKSQKAKRRVIKIDKPIYYSEGDVHLVALPAEEFRISYTMHYPQSPLLGSQYYSAVITPELFKEEIAPCRTFSLYEEIVPFIEKGIIKGGGLDNALVIQGNRIMNPGGARFPNEMVRHKVLDLIGDLSLVGAPILGHIISICSGHATNIAFARMIQQGFS